MKSIATVQTRKKYYITKGNGSIARWFFRFFLLSYQFFDFSNMYGFILSYFAKVYFKFFVRVLGRLKFQTNGIPHSITSLRTFSGAREDQLVE